MGVLRNPKHEAFAQAVASMAKNGQNVVDCYEVVGFKRSRKNAHRLRTREDVSRRIEEILSQTAQRLDLSRDRWLLEVARIAYGDMRKAVEWHGDLTEVEENEAGGDVLLIKKIFSNRVRLKSSAELDDDTAAAISEVRQYADGSVGLKMHSKTSALEMLGKYFGNLKDPPIAGDVHNHLHVTPDQLAQFAAMPKLERARRMILALELIAREHEETKVPAPTVIEGNAQEVQGA